MNQFVDIVGLVGLTPVICLQIGMTLIVGILLTLPLLMLRPGDLPS